MTPVPGTIQGGVPASPAETVRERCKSMGLSVWRADTSGVITDEPQEAGLAGLWLRSAHVTAMVAEAAREWSETKKPTIRRLMPGCWLIPLPEEHARRRAGMTLAMALGQDCLTCSDFSSACRAARLDEETTRATLRRLTAFDEPSARRASSTLTWMLRDLALLAEYQDAVSGFTTELTDSYETIDLLYGLGRSMLDLDHPERFVSLLCDRLYDTMPFAWVAARFMPTEAALASLNGQVLVRGQPPVSGSELAAAVTRLAMKAPADRRGFIISAFEAFGENLPAGGAADHATPNALAPLPHLPSSGAGGRILVQPVTRGDELAGILLVGDKHGEDPQISSYDIQLLEAAAAFTGAFLENTQLYRDHQLMFLGSIRALTSAIDAKDRYTCGHSERVALMARNLARAAGMAPDISERVHIAGLLHDVGKIGVPEAVLTKPGRLTDSEFALIKLHPEIGHRILKDIPQLSDVLPGVLSHHERWDGNGYPHRLAREDIPIFARLLALADTFDAMSSTRSYRAAMPRDQVLAEIRRSAGAQFDPQLAQLFVTLDLREYDAMVARHAREHGSAARPEAPGLAAAA